MAIFLAETGADLARCSPVLQELRPKFLTVEALSEALGVMRSEGTRIAALEQEGEITTVACFRMHHMLVSGRTLYVDDLVTAERFRSRGHGKAMLEWLMAYGQERGCQTFSLDSGTFRQSAHAFYFREGLRISSFHFERALQP